NTWFVDVDRIETPDRSTVTFKMKQTFAPFINYLAAMPTAIMSKPWLLSGKDPTKETMGSGPFAVGSYTRNVELSYKKNPNYWVQGRPYVDGFKYTIIPDASARVAAIRTGQLTLLGLQPEDRDSLKKSNPELLMEIYLQRTFSCWRINTAQAP